MRRPHPFRSDETKNWSRARRPLYISLDGARAPVSRPAPITAYFPSGIHNGPVPVGKYYPSNYENRNITSTSDIAISIAASRAESEMKCRLLQQYRRDIRTQVALEAEEVLRAAVNRGMPPLDAVSLRVFHLGRSMVQSHAPVPPQLRPLERLDPVTPMTLEDHEDCYFTKGRHVDEGDLDA